MTVRTPAPLIVRYGRACAPVRPVFTATIFTLTSPRARRFSPRIKSIWMNPASRWGIPLRHRSPTQCSPRGSCRQSPTPRRRAALRLTDRWLGITDGGRGLARTGRVTQMESLVALGRANEFADLYEPGATEVERVRARLLLKTLIHPEGVGETFKVLIQHKLGEQAQPQLTGLAGI